MLQSVKRVKPFKYQLKTHLYKATVGVNPIYPLRESMSLSIYFNHSQEIGAQNKEKDYFV